MPVYLVSEQEFVALDDLAGVFQLSVHDSLGAITVSYKGKTIVLTPDQALASVSGKLISLPAGPSRLTAAGVPARWLVPVEFISRALAPIYDVRLDFRPASRLLVIGDLRVPRVVAQYDASPGSLRVTLEITPRSAPDVTQEQNRLLVRIDADSLDASLPQPPQQQLLTGIRVTEPNTIQMDLGQRFSTFRTVPPVSSGAAAVFTIELLAAHLPHPTHPSHPTLRCPCSEAQRGHLFARS